MGLYTKFKHDKLFLFFFLLIIALGLFVRLNDFSEVQYWNDDITTIPTGLLAFYPHSFYPGLAGQGEPILGNLIIGAGCMFSGEDFSLVNQIRPMFYPGREELIGQEMVNAFPYCHIPMYLFGILFFLAISLLALTLLPKYSSLFAISFFAFYPRLLQLSRWIHVDIFGYFFIVLGLLFLWYTYNSERNNKEFFFFIISFIFFALAFTVKLPNGIFLLFATFILFEKYKSESLQLIRKLGLKLDLNICKRMEFKDLNVFRPLKIFILSFIFYIFAVLIPFYFNPKNLLDIIQKYQLVNPNQSTFTFNTKIFTVLLNFLLTLNIFEIILFIFLLIFLVSIIKTRKNKKENFILYLFLFFIFVLLFFKTLIYPRIFIAFSFGLIFLTSLLFSNREYSIFKLFHIRRRKLFFSIFLIVYVIFSFTTALSVSPHFEKNNPLLCKISNSSNCQTDFLRFVQKDVANYFKSVLEENETFYWGRLEVLHYYLRPEESFQNYLFERTFTEKIKRMPLLQDYIQYFTPNNRNVRYVLIEANQPRLEQDMEIKDLKENYEPNQIIYLNEEAAAYIYDLKNLVKK
jgi:hypothetical protein